MIEEFQEILKKQKIFFDNNETLDIQVRIEYLKRFKSNIKKYENAVLDALKADLNRDQTVGWFTELKIVYDELDQFIKHLWSWSKDKKVKPILLLFHKKACITYTPRGQVYLVVPFNFPILLSLQPLVGSVGAGNVTFCKLSYQTPSTNEVLVKIIQESFPPELVYVTKERVDHDTLDWLNKYLWDFIFFTGSQNTAAKIYQEQYMNFTPAVFELGGKSPMVVDESADLTLAAKKFLNAKLINSGQICVGVDYLILHEKIKEQFVQVVKNLFNNDYSKRSYMSGALINQKKADEVNNFLHNENTSDFDVLVWQNVKGYDELRLGLIDYAKVKNKLYLDSIELFSPLSYYKTFKTEQDVYDIVNQHDFPLAFYVFSNNPYFIYDLKMKTRSGAFSVNDTLVHVFHTNLPFGGIKNSGLESYHGFKSFQVFSHNKPTLSSKWFGDKYVDEEKFFDGNYWITKFLRKH